MTSVEPVEDWAEDFELFDPDYVDDPAPIWRALRDGGCPFARTERRQVSYLPTTFQGVRDIAAYVETWSSRSVSVVPDPNPDPDAPTDDAVRVRSIIDTDPPLHTPERRLMLPFFSPRSVERYRDHTRDLCRRLILGFIEDGEADIADRYARQIPPRIIARILGIDPEMADEFSEWVQGFLEIGQVDPEARQYYDDKITEFFVAEIEDRIANPGDDLISMLLQSEIDGAPVPLNVVQGNVFLMLIAGIDTTWSSIGSALWHLASHPDDRRRLVAEPELVPTAVEEFLRAYAPVTMARVATVDTTLGEREVKAGERVVLSFPAANRDPAVFERPDEVVIDRRRNRHVAFGSGIHRCAGSNLARLEMTTAVRVWLERIPEFHVSDRSPMKWAGGQVRGCRLEKTVVEIIR